MNKVPACTLSQLLSTSPCCNLRLPSSDIYNTVWNILFFHKVRQSEPRRTSMNFTVYFCTFCKISSCEFHSACLIFFRLNFDNYYFIVGLHFFYNQYPISSNLREQLSEYDGADFVSSGARTLVPEAPRPLPSRHGIGRYIMGSRMLHKIFRWDFWWLILVLHIILDFIYLFM